MAEMRSVLVLLIALLAAGCGRIDPTLELSEARASMAASDYRTAAIRIGNVLQLQPDNGEAHLLRGRLATALGDYATAVVEIERARDLGVASSAAALDLADALLRRGDRERAAATLEAASAELSGEPLYWQLRAEIFLQSAAPGDAARALDRVVAPANTTPRYLVARARVALANDAAAEAESLFAQAAAASLPDAEAHMAFAEALAGGGRLREAAAQATRAAELYRADGRAAREASVLVNLVQLHVATNELGAAQSAIDRLAAITPNAAVTAYVRGLVEYRRGGFDNAARYLQQAVAAEPGNRQALTLLAAVQLALGNFAQAEQQLLTVLAGDPADTAAVKLLAEVRLQQQRPQAALEALQPLAGAGLEDARVGLLTGLANLSAGRSEQGLLYLEQAAGLDPSDHLVRFELARAYASLGRHEDAAQVLRLDLGTDGRSQSVETRFIQLISHVSRSDPAAGARAVTELLEGAPRDPEALTAAALYYRMSNDRARARELLDRAVENDRSFVTARNLLAGVLIEEGRIDEAERQLREVVTIEPSNTRAFASLAQLAIGRNDFAAAEALLRQSLEHTTEAAARLALARFYVSRGRLAEAGRLVGEAAARAPEDPEVLATAGLVALLEGRTADAVQLLERARAPLENRLGVVVALAEAYLQSGKGEAARATLREALAAVPDSLPLRVALGTAELRLGNVDEVMSIARRLQAEFPTRTEGYLLGGEANIARRQYDLAVQDLRTAYQQDQSWRSLSRLVDTLGLANRSGEVLSVLEQRSARHPNEVRTQLALASAYEAAGRNEDALGQYERVLQTNPNNVVALNNAAWLYHLAGDSRALALAESAYRLAPDSAAVLDTLGTILLAANRDRDAIGHLERAAQLAPEAPEIRYHLAQAQVELRRLEAARATLEALLQDTRPFESRAAAQELLRSL